MNRKRVMIAGVMALAMYLALALFGFAALVSASSGTTLEIEITIADVQSLYGFDFKLYYSTECLDLVEALPSPPWDLNVILKNENDEAAGIYRLAAVGVAPTSPFDGSTTLAKLTFLCTTPGEEAFSLGDIALADQSGNAIPYATNGLVIQALPVHDVAVTDILGSPRGVYQGSPITVVVTVRNHGNFLESFDVTLYADKDESLIGNEYIVGVQKVADLPAKTSRTIAFVWDTHTVAYGAYWLSAEASVVSGETDTADNFLKCGDWIGGIYAPIRVRQTANMLLILTSTSIVASLMLIGSVGIKKYWFP